MAEICDDETRNEMSWLVAANIEVMAYFVQLLSAPGLFGSLDKILQLISSNADLRKADPIVMRSIILLFLSTYLTHAFVPKNRQRRRNGLHMVPKFDKETQLWSPTSPEEGPEAGYPAVNTLLRHGPLPFIQRVFSSDDYEQGVLKFMAGDKCSRDVAQGNMDAFLSNPNDWAVDRMQAEKTGYYPDYVTLDNKRVALTLVWTGLLVAFVREFVKSVLHI